MKSRKFLAVFAFTLLSIPVTAQVRASRDVGNGVNKHPAGWASRVLLSYDGKMLIRMSGPTGRTEFQTGLVTVGSYALIGTSIGSGVLVCGEGPGGGLIEHWAPAASGGWALQSSYTLTGADFTGVAFDGGVLYAMDCRSHTILAAPWLPLQSLSGLTLSVWATPAEIPSLAEAEGAFLRWFPAGALPDITGPAMLLVRDEDALLSQGPLPGILIQGMPGPPVTQPYVYRLFPPGPFVVVDQRSVRHGGTSVDVFTGCPQSVEVVDSHGIVLGTATLPAAGSFPVTLSTPLLVGETYVARVPGTAIAESFRCLRRHGFPETFANGTRMETMLLHPAAHTVGNARFSIRARLVRSGNMGPELAFSGLMIVGFDGTPILPVENGQGTNQLLLSEFWFGATGMVAENARDGFLTMSLPIPNDPTLEGTILLAQFVVSDTASLRLGEIVGFKIGAAN